MARGDGTVDLVLPPYAALGRASLTVTPDRGAPVQLGPFRYAGGDTLRLTRQSSG